MLKIKCPACAKKIERKFNFCPYCGLSFKKRSEKKDYGLLGREDTPTPILPEFKIPLGMDKIVNSLMKQLEKQMTNLSYEENGSPRGLKISFSTGKPPTDKLIENSQKEKKSRVIPSENLNRIKNLPKILIPGVKSKEEIFLIELANGMEVKACAKDKCYTKFIPFKVDLIKHYLERDKLILEIKN
jgi:hypothetical protein